MSKYKQRYLQPSGWSLKGHWMVGYEWLCKGSKGSQYVVEAHDQGFTCSCYGFTYHGRCRHVREIVGRIEGPAPVYSLRAIEGV